MGCCCGKCCEKCDPCCRRIGCSCRDNGGKRFADIEQNRACTDIPCLILFIIFTAWVTIHVWIFSFAKGDPNQLLSGVDFEGRVCGDNDIAIIKDRPYAYWPDPTLFRFKVCIENCNETWYDTELYYDRYCLPTADSGIKIDGYDTFAGFISRGIADLNKSIVIIIVSIILSCLLAFFYIWLMKKCVGCLVWSTIIAIIIGGILASLSFLAKANDLSDSGDKSGANTQKGIGYVIAVFTFIFILIIIFARKRIQIAIAVIKSASRAIGDMPCIVFFPLIPLFILVSVFIAWMFASFYIFSTADNVEKNISDNLINIATVNSLVFYEGTRINFTATSTSQTYKVKDYNTARGLFAPHFFFLLWITQILTYFTFTTIAGAIADWYFTERDMNGNKKRGTNQGELTPSPVTSACKRTCRYHLGSIFYAAFLIAVIQFIRWCIRYMERMANGGKKPNRLQRLLFKLVDCLLWCLECCLDKISRNALIFVAIYGDAFCPAVCSSFALIWANLMRVAAISFFSTIVTTLGKIFVPIMTVGICGLVLLYVSPYDTKVSSPFVPLVVIFIMSIAIASLFIVVYDTAIDSVFVCFLIDEKHNKHNGKMLADDDLRTIVQKYEVESKEIAQSMQREGQGETTTEVDTTEI